jgi:hypothetical protein
VYLEYRRRILARGILGATGKHRRALTRTKERVGKRLLFRTRAAVRRRLAPLLFPKM